MDEKDLLIAKALSDASLARSQNAVNMNVTAEMLKAKTLKSEADTLAVVNAQNAARMARQQAREQEFDRRIQGNALRNQEIRNRQLESEIAALKREIAEMRETTGVAIDKAIKERRLYFVGDALPSDWYAAFRLWLPLAEAGDPQAQFNVGRCYDRGDGVDKDSSKAKYWYLKAAGQNDPRALFNLYLFFSDAKSAEKDSETAEAYLKHAVELQEERALEVMDKRTAEEEKLRIEREKNDYEMLRKSCLDAIQEALLKGDKDEAIKLIKESASHPELSWMAAYQDFFEVKFVDRQRMGKGLVNIEYRNDSGSDLQIACAELGSKGPYQIRCKKIIPAFSNAVLEGSHEVKGIMACQNDGKPLFPLYIPLSIFRPMPVRARET